MKDNVNRLKKDKTKLSIVFSMFILCFCYAVYLVSGTYAASSYTVVFNRAEGNDVMNKCTTDTNGKLGSNCIDVSSEICTKWSTDIYQYSGYQQKDSIIITNFYDMTFSKDMNYYCVAGSSLSGAQTTGCYVCNDNENIMEWKTNGSSDNNCAAGYTIKENVSSIDNCKPIILDACYECKTDKNIMKWDNNGEPDKNCSSGYEVSTTITDEANCEPVIPDACYVCKADDKIMKWDNNGTVDNKCSSGYYKINANQSECKPVENPPTGENILMAVIWFFGLGCLGYSLYYFKKINIKN